MALADDIGRNLVAELNEAKNRAERKEIFKSYQQLSGYSLNTLNREAHRFGWKLKRKTRSDKGSLKVDLNDEQIKALIRIKMGTRDKKYKIPRIPIWRILQIAEIEGIIPKGQLSINQLNRLFKNIGLSNKDLIMEKDKSDPVRMKTEHPNDCWMVDTTWCAQVRLKNNGRFDYVDPEDHRNKPGGKEPKLFRYMIVDHASGAFYVDYYLGENIKNMADFLWKAFSPKPDMNREPMRGLPKILFGDKGSVNRAAALQNMLKHLGIEWRDHMVGNPRAKGAVEFMMDYWQRCFETGLMLQKASTLEELRRWSIFLRQYINCALKHSRHGMTRAVAWNMIPADNLIMLLSYEIYQKLFTAVPAYRKVQAGRIIEFEGEKYELGGKSPTKEMTALIGEKIKIFKSPFKWDEENRIIEVELNESIYELEPIKTTVLNFPVNAPSIVKKEFKKYPEKQTQKILKKAGIIDERGQRVSADKIAENFKSNILYVDKNDFPEIALMPKKSSPMLIETMERRMTRIQGLMELSRLLKRKFSPEESQVLLARMDSEVSDKDIRAMAQELKGESIGIAAEKSIG